MNIHSIINTFDTYIRSSHFFTKLSKYITTTNRKTRRISNNAQIYDVLNFILVIFQLLTL
jgi:hypothetical protein